MVDRINVDAPAPKPKDPVKTIRDLTPVEWFWWIAGGSLCTGALISTFILTLPSTPAFILTACTIIGVVGGGLTAISRAFYEIERTDRLAEEEAKRQRRGY